MKFSVGWLLDYLEPGHELLNKIEYTLNQAGMEVQKIVDKTSLKGFELARVDSVEKHPSADNLKVCTVKGKTIVCGAKNVRPGMITVLANVNSVMPETGLEINPTNLRGVMSHGMLCSAEELGLFDETNGIMDVIDNKTLEEIMLPNGPIFDVDITPDRGDLLNVYGIARELAAFGLGKLKDPGLYSLQLHFDQTNEVIDIQSDDTLSMYTLNIHNIHNNLTPDWMKIRLKEVGINSHSCVVDITNYISHSLGQPLHAFDADKIKHIQVKTYSQEEFMDLKGEVYRIENLMCMVSEGKCVSIPGVIGAEYGKFAVDSKNLLLEAGNYTQSYIYKAQSMVKKTYASRKFFAKIDPMMTKTALVEAAALVQKFCGSSFGRATCAKQYHYVGKKIPFPKKHLIQIGISENQGHEYLTSLGFVRAGETYQVPSWRHNLNTEESLLHEILRRYDFNKIEGKAFDSNSILLPKDKTQEVKTILISEGLYEVLGKGFMSREMNQVFEQVEKLNLLNGMHKGQYTMRNSILPNLIEFSDLYIRHKWNYQGIFEIGKVFTEKQEQEMLGIAFPVQSHNWLSSNINNNFFTAKKIVEKCVKYLFGNVQCYVMDDHKILKDACQWRNVEGSVIATFGIFAKSEVMKTLKIKSNLYMAEINLSGVRNDKYHKITDHETLTKDISVFLPRNIYTADVVREIEKVSDEIQVQIFDVYPDACIEQEERSVGIRLFWSGLTRTLATEEIKSILAKISDLLQKIGCKVREK